MRRSVGYRADTRGEEDQQANGGDGTVSDRWVAFPIKGLGWLVTRDNLQGTLTARDRFADLYQNGQIPEYHHIVDTILYWSEEILARHHNRRYNGRLERPTTSSKPSEEPLTGSQPPRVRLRLTKLNQNLALVVRPWMSMYLGE